jgi:peptidoglycan-associated lipoprotein
MTTHSQARGSDSLTLAFTLALTLALIAVVAGGCQTKNSRHANAGPGAAHEGDMANNDHTTADPGNNVSGDPIGFKSSDLQIVYFDYDTAILRDDAREALKADAALLKKHPDLHIQIAGHCDERGTQAYNLALGERRAQAVREYLGQLGVPSARLVTISYGKEKPADPGNDESAWAKNRRCEFNKNQ